MEHKNCPINGINMNITSPWIYYCKICMIPIIEKYLNEDNTDKNSDEYGHWKLIYHLHKNDLANSYLYFDKIKKMTNVQRNVLTIIRDYYFITKQYELAKKYYDISIKHRIYTAFLKYDIEIFSQFEDIDKILSRFLTIKKHCKNDIIYSLIIQCYNKLYYNSTNTLKKYWYVKQCKTIFNKWILYAKYHSAANINIIINHIKLLKNHNEMFDVAKLLDDIYIYIIYSISKIELYYELGLWFWTMKDIKNANYCLTTLYKFYKCEIDKEKLYTMGSIFEQIGDCDDKVQYCLSSAIMKGHCLAILECYDFKSKNIYGIRAYYLMALDNQCINDENNDQQNIQILNKILSACTINEIYDRIHNKQLLDKYIATIDYLKIKNMFDVEPIEKELFCQQNNISTLSI